jgi:hypothetical protein
MLIQNMESKILRCVRSLTKQVPQRPFFAHSTFKKKKRHLLYVSRDERYRLCIKWQYMHKIYKIIKLHCYMLNIIVTNRAVFGMNPHI